MYKNIAIILLSFLSFGLLYANQANIVEYTFRAWRVEFVQTYDMGKINEYKFWVEKTETWVLTVEQTMNNVRGDFLNYSLDKKYRSVSKNTYWDFIWDSYGYGSYTNMIMYNLGLYKIRDNRDVINEQVLYVNDNLTLIEVIKGYSIKSFNIFTSEDIANLFLKK